jgi:hypothetical protein
MLYAAVMAEFEAADGVYFKSGPELQPHSVVVFPSNNATVIG